jgi:5-methylcytosine-specific restriction protein B
MLRRIDTSTLEQLRKLLANDQIDVAPIVVQYESYTVRNKITAPESPLRFRWWHDDQTEPLLYDLTTWATQESQKFPGTYLILGTDRTPRVVGFPLYWLPQDDEFVYLSFKLGTNDGGKNRWFGRARAADEPRSLDRTNQLVADLRQALQQAFLGPLLINPSLSGDWIVLAKLPLTQLRSNASAKQKSELKTLILEQLLRAFIIAEKLRADSFVAPDVAETINRNTLIQSNSFSMDTPRNQLLYGPPGTGKTYHTAVRALGILAGKTDQQITAAYTREQIRQELDKYRATGQLEFVTFHQAFSYEDFVEGIKPVIAALNSEEEREESPDLRYDIERGIFRILTERSAYALYLQQRQRLVADNLPQATVELDFDTVFETLKQKWQQQLAQEKEVALPTSGAEIVLQSINAHGTFHFKYRKSKTDNLPQTTRKGLRKISDSNPYQPPTPEVESAYEVNYGRDRSVYRAVFRELRKLEQQMRAATSPQSPITPSLNEALERAVADHGIAAENIQEFDYKSLKEQDLAQAPRFVLIIDEINRGNVANIFGELITLLEKDKRAGQPEMLTAKLPYSKALFTVPDNLYLLGTMNTADRSVEALDTALRRRFSFTEMRPDADVIRKQVGTNGIIGTGTEAINVAEILEVLNSRLEQLLDHDHCLGHALLLDAQLLETLKTSFEHGIIPLLQEYFFADWGKIGLVLGTKFVEVIKPNTPGRRKLAAFPGYDAHGMGERPIYKLISPDAWTAATFQSIYA